MVAQLAHIVGASNFTSSVGSWIGLKIVSFDLQLRIMKMVISRSDFFVHKEKGVK